MNDELSPDRNQHPANFEEPAEFLVHKQVAHQKQSLERLMETSALLHSERTRQDVLERILKGVQDSGFDRVRLFLLSPDGQNLHGVAQHGMSKELFDNVSWPTAEDSHFQILLREPHSHIFDDTSENFDPHRERFGKAGIQWAAVPLILRGCVIGHLAVDNKFSRRLILESELAPLTLFAMQAAAAIEKADLTARDAKKLQLSARLVQATTEIVSQIGKLGLPELLTLVAQQASELLEAEVCSVLLRKTHDRLSLEAGYGYCEGSFQPGLEIPLESSPHKSFTGYVAYQGELVNLHGEALRNHEAVRTYQNSFLPSGHCYSVLALPLKQQGEVVALLRADNKKGSDGRSLPSLNFTEEDVSILRSFGSVIAVCLERAKQVAQLASEREAKEGLISNLPQAAIAVDLKGNVIEFNQQAERILGFKAAEVRGTKVSRYYYDPEEPRRIGDALKKRSDGRLNGYPTQIRTKLGQPLPIRLSVYWLEDKGERRGSVGIFDDSLELTLRAMRTLTEADDLSNGLQRLAELLIERFPDTLCGVLLYDEKSEWLIEQAAAYRPGQGGLNATPGSQKRKLAANLYEGLADILKNGHPVTLRYSDSRVRKNLELLSERAGFSQPIQSLLIIPLKLGDRLLGVFDLIELCPETETQFTRENVVLAATIAAQSAIFIDRMQTTERGREKLLAFYQGNAKLLEQKDPEQLLREMVRETREAAGASIVDLVLIDEEERAEAPISVPERSPEQQLLVSPNGVSIQVFRSGLAKYFPDLSKEKDHLNPELVKNSKAAICLPLSLPYRRIGVLWLRYDYVRLFPEEEVTALQLFVSQAAIAYENAQGADRQKRITPAAEALGGAMELPEVCQQILSRGREALQADAMIFGYFDHANNTFVRRFSQAAGIDKKLWDDYLYLGMEEDNTSQRLLAEGAVFINNLNDKKWQPVLREKSLGFLQKSGIASLQAIALKAGEERLGLVCALYRKPRSFNEKERQLTAAFARYAAQAIKKAKLFEQVRKTNEAATVVAKITVLGQREATLNAIVEEVRKVTDCDVVVLFEYDQEKQRLMKPVVTGLNQTERATRYAKDLGFPLVEKVLVAEEPYKVEQVSTHPEFKDRPFAKDLGIQSCVAFCLRAAGDKVGVLFINFRTERHFTAEELATMQLFATQAALAIHYAQSTESDESKLRELTALKGLSDQLRQAQSLDELFACTVALAAKELGVEFCNLVLPDRNGKLRLCAQYGWLPKLEPQEFVAGRGSQTGFTLHTGKPVIVDDIYAKQDFTVVQHLFDYGVKSSLSVPMFRDQQMVGALLAFTKTPRHFTDEDTRFLSLIADHTATAMRSMERFEDLQRRDNHLQAVHRSSQAILASFGDEQKVLDQIVKEAVESVTGITAPKAVYGTMQLYNEASDELQTRSIYPPESQAMLLEHVDEGRWSLDPTKAPHGRIGVTGRSIKEGHSQLVGDLSQNPDYIQYNEQSKSELCVPLFSGGKIIGTINVESDQLNGFDENDRLALEALADHAVMALQIAHTHRELRETKGIVGTRTALAWMGMANNAWRHTIAGDAAEIVNRLTLLREFLKPGEVNEERIHRHLAQIERLAKGIQERPVTPPLSSEEGVVITNLNDLVTERLSQLRQRHRYQGLKFEAQPSKTPLFIRASPEWLRRALDILVDNAARFTRAQMQIDPARCQVIVRTALDSQTVELYVTDSGPGISPEIRNRLFNGKIESAHGQGIGLLIAQAVVETYGGKIKVHKSDSHGTEMIIRLPHHR
jgi:PAS domain S-box-containing protein